MALFKTSLKKLSKEEVVNLALDYHSKFDSTLVGKRNEFSELKKGSEKLGSELAVRKHFNGMLDKRVTNMERQCWSNSQQSRQEYLEVTGIPEGSVVNSIKGIWKIRSKGEPSEYWGLSIDKNQ